MGRAAEQRYPDGPRPPDVAGHCDVRMFGWVRSSSRDILKNIRRNSKGLMNYYNSSQIHFPANSNQYRFNNEFISNQKLLTRHSIASFDLQLSATYDPRHLAQHNLIGLVGDETEAHDWYQRANELGSAEAGRILAQHAD